MGRCGEGDLRGGTAAVRVALPDALRAEHGRARASIFFIGGTILTAEVVRGRGRIRVWRALCGAEVQDSIR